MSPHSDLEYIEKLYSQSTAPVAVADKKLNIIWTNNAAATLYPSLTMPDGFIFINSDTDKISAQLFDKKSLTITSDSFLFSGALISLTYIEQSALVLINFSPVSQEDYKTAVSNDKAISSFSNQFRSPLTIIFSALSSISRQLQKDGIQKNKAVFDSLRTVNRSCYNILKNCNNIVMFNKYKTASIQSDFQRVSVKNYFSELFKAVSVFTNALYIPLEINLEENVDIICDPDKIGLVFINLIANCCKFTRPSNKITICAKKSGERMVFTVSDLGCGMSEHVLTHAFDAFFSYDPKMQYCSSAGLGLTIAKLIITEHHGTIAIESKENVGTKIIFSLPICGENEKNIPLKFSAPSSDYLSDKFSDLFIHMSETSNCPMA